MTLALENLRNSVTPALRQSRWENFINTRLDTLELESTTKTYTLNPKPLNKPPNEKNASSSTRCRTFTPYRTFKDP